MYLFCRKKIHFLLVFSISYLLRFRFQLGNRKRRCESQYFVVVVHLCRCGQYMLFPQCGHFLDPLQDLWHLSLWQIRVLTLFSQSCAKLQEVMEKWIIYARNSPFLHLACTQSLYQACQDFTDLNDLNRRQGCFPDTQWRKQTL